MAHEIDGRSELARAIGEIAEAEMPRARLREVAAATGFDRGFWELLRESGLLGVLVPEALGGLGLGIHEVTGIFYELGRSPVPGPVLDNAVAAPLLQAASADPSVFDAYSVISLADPGALPGTRGAGRLQIADGRLRGSVDLVRAADVADAFVAVATEPDGGTSVFLVPAGAGGVVVGVPRLLELGVRHGTVTFDVAAGDALLLVCGEPGTAAVSAMRTALRIAVAAEIAGAGRAMLDLAASYSLVRSQFGQAIASFQALQQLLAETFEHSSALNSLLDWCAEELPRADAERAAGIAVEAKAGAAELGRLIAENALQAHGGIGFTAEHDLAIYYKLFLVREPLYGDRRTLSLGIGERVLASG